MDSPPFADASALPWQPVAPGVERQVLAHDDGLMLVRVRFEAGAVGTVHPHPHRQVSYVETGVFEVEVGDERRVLRAGDGFVVAPDVLHGVVAHEAGVLLDVFSPAREEFLD
ncbi:cupin domain-containing protein [Rubrivirga marina]|uniref:Cupin n=1 Tax=Rubrivirga marina TaxID=1196024 RepID=A0A271IVK1_9BACT|nr:cupin domain-containing protein [Rubrivirga marina]PAP75140.1 cupin [Rubrivirga marina]